MKCELTHPGRILVALSWTLVLLAAWAASGASRAADQNLFEQARKSFDPYLHPFCLPTVPG